MQYISMTKTVKLTEHLRPMPDYQRIIGLLAQSKNPYLSSHGTTFTTTISSRYSNDNHDTWG